MRTLNYIEFTLFTLWAGITKMPIGKYNYKLKKMMKRHGHPLVD
jgi:hypothetical protein